MSAGESDLATAQQRIAELTSKLSVCTDRWRVLDQERHDVRKALGAADVETTVQAAERIVAVRAVETACRVDETHAWHTLLTAAQQRIVELESVVAGNPVALGALLKVKDDERDALKARVAELEAERTTMCDRMSRIDEGERRVLAEYDEVVADLKQRDARVAELEALGTEETTALLALLHAIWPVYRAGHDWVYEGQGFRPALVASIHTARSLLTPELLAAAKAAGLEVGE